MSDDSSAAQSWQLVPSEPTGSWVANLQGLGWNEGSEAPEEAIRKVLEAAPKRKPKAIQAATFMALCGAILEELGKDEVVLMATPDGRGRFSAQTRTYEDDRVRIMRQRTPAGHTFEIISKNTANPIAVSGHPHEIERVKGDWQALLPHVNNLVSQCMV